MKQALKCEILFCLKVISSSKFESGIHNLSPKFSPFPVFLLALNSMHLYKTPWNLEAS